MKRILKNFLKKLHVHWYNKPLVSQYGSFHVRYIIYECRCGYRKEYTITRGFDEDFPIPTTQLITDKEMKRILDGEAVNKVLLRGQN